MRFLTAFVLAATVLASGPGQAAEFITVASTTSTQNSGLFAYLLPLFTATTNIEVRVVAVGTGQAVRMAERGDADVLFVHHRPSEDKFVREGYGVKRYDVMMNDFVLIGPKSDPANAKPAATVEEALRAIANRQSPFVSRGDDSGTNKRELALWRSVDLDPKTVSGTWYREAGAGMGATLNMAQGMGAYTLADRGTWIAFKNKSELTIVSQGSANLANPYGVILVNPKRFSQIKSKPGQKFIDWLVSAPGQTAIANYKVQGQQLFFPTAQTATAQ